MTKCYLYFVIYISLTKTALTGIYMIGNPSSYLSLRQKARARARERDGEWINVDLVRAVTIVEVSNTQADQIMLTLFGFLFEDKKCLLYTLGMQPVIAPT